MVKFGKPKKVSTSKLVTRVISLCIITVEIPEKGGEL
jgi:hypothetical protein